MTLANRRPILGDARPMREEWLTITDAGVGDVQIPVVPENDLGESVVNPVIYRQVTIAVIRECCDRLPV